MKLKNKIELLNKLILLNNIFYKKDGSDNYYLLMQISILSRQINYEAHYFNMPLKKMMSGMGD